MTLAAMYSIRLEGLNKPALAHMHASTMIDDGNSHSPLQAIADHSPSAISPACACGRREEFAWRTMAAVMLDQMHTRACTIGSSVHEWVCMEVQGMAAVILDQFCDQCAGVCARACAHL